jgi:predicted oxidoreductase
MPHQCGKISNASSMWKDTQCLINVERYPMPHHCGKISNASSMWKDTQSLINVERYPMPHPLDIFPH